MVKLKEKGQSVKRNFLYNIVYQLLVMIIPVVTTPYVARVLQADGVGTYSYVLSIVTYFGLFGTLGLTTYGQLEIAANRDNSYIVSQKFWSILITRIVTMTVSGAVYYLFILTDSPYKEIYFILSIYLFAQALDISWFFQGLEQFKITVLGNFIIKVISIILIFILVKEKNDLNLYIIILHGSTLLGNLALWPYLKKYLVKIKIKDIKIISNLQRSLIYFVPNIATSIYTVLDKSMVGWLTGSNLENGYLDQAHKIEMILLTIVTELSTVTLPRLRYLFTIKNNSQIKQITDESLSFVMMIAFPMALGLIVVSKDLIPWFLGPGYDECIPILRIFSTLIIFIGLNDAIGRQCLMAAERQKQFNTSVIIGAIVNFSCNMILIVRFGAQGAAFSSVIAECVILLLFIWYSLDLLDCKSLVRNATRYLISSLLMAAIVFLFSNCIDNLLFSLIFQVIVGIIIYLLLLIVKKDPIVKTVYLDIRRKFVQKKHT